MSLQDGDPGVHAALNDAFRTDRVRMLGTLVRLLGDLDRAEEVLQEAFAAAVDAWEREGVPAHPTAWLISAARFKGIDGIRRERRGRELTDQLHRRSESSPGGVDFTDPGHLDGIRDDELRLIFLCCHPDIPLDSRIALALREVCGLTTEEIARAYLIAKETAKKRITRAKQSIRRNAIPFELPPSQKLRRRLDAVLQVVYLVYNEGFAASSGDSFVRPVLTHAAVSWARLLVDLLPDSESFGLLALLLLHESRSAARVDENGDIVPLAEQDRRKWDREMIDEGTGLVQRALWSGRAGFYTIQAAIVSVHAAADSMESTAWSAIVFYYDLLLRVSRSPVVALNRAIAIGMRDTPEEGLRLIRPLVDGGPLSRYHNAHAARADLARRMGNRVEAVNAFRSALRLNPSEPERRHIEKELAKIL